MRPRRALLLAGAAAAAALSLQPNPSDTISAALDGLVRSSRALYTIGVVVADYRCSLRGLDSDHYRAGLSQVHLRSAGRILRLCETNRGFYLKAGQFVSSLRQIPKEYTSILSSLQDKAVPYCFEDIEQVLIKNLGKDLSQVFLKFDEEPIAAASIAQVHHARLKDGQEVAVKVQYPGLERKLKVDITTMAFLSNLVAWFFPDYRFGKLVSEFERTITLELDFVKEAENAERTARNFRHNPLIKVPSVFWEKTTSQVLTMQFCHGHRVDDLDFLKQSGIDSMKVAKALMDVFAEMIFVHGFLHRDPHPGNILVSPEGTANFSLVILDHGMYKELDDRFRLTYCQFWKALIFLDTQQIQQLGERLGVGKYAMYFPVIFTGRTMSSKSALGKQMSIEERSKLKQELKHLDMGDMSLFIESLSPDFLAVLRVDGLLRSVVGKLGAPRRVRLFAYAKYAIYGLSSAHNTQHDSKTSDLLLKTRTSLSYLQLRILLEILDLITWLQRFKHSFATEIRSILASCYRFCSWDFFNVKT